MTSLEEIETLYGDQIETIPRIIRENYLPPERLRKKEIKRMIAYALEACSHRQRIAVYLVDYQGYTLLEAGETMKIRPGTVSHYRDEARKRMAARLKKFGFKEIPRLGLTRRGGRKGRWEMTEAQRQTEDDRRNKWPSQ